MNNNNLYVTLTSWPKRINNAMKVLDSIYRNTVQPTGVFLNLSIEEFPNRENDLPIELKLFYKHNQNRLFINWVNKNTKSFKKIVPILHFLNDDDLILNIDDDFYLPPKLIESRLQDFRIFKSPITSNRTDYSSNSKAKIRYYMGSTSLISKKMLNGWEKFYVDEVMDLLEDDRVNTYILYKNGFYFQPCSDHNIVEILKNYNISSNDGNDLYRHYNIRTTKILEEKLFDIVNGVTKKYDVDFYKNLYYRSLQDDKIEYEDIDKQKLLNELKSIKKSRIKNIDCVISLTSIPERFTLFDNFKRTIESLKNQKTNFKYRVVLTILDSDLIFVDNNLFEYLKKSKIEIITCRHNTKGNKKYLYSGVKYSDFPLILVDDDLIYSEHMVESLMQHYNKKPNIMWSGWVHEFKINEDGTIFLSKFDDLILSDNPLDDYTTSYNLLPASGSGCIIPPKLIIDNLDSICEKLKFIGAINHDEVVLKSLANDKRIKVGYAKNIDVDDQLNCEKRKIFLMKNSSFVVECDNIFTISSLTKINSKTIQYDNNNIIRGMITINILLGEYRYFDSFILSVDKPIWLLFDRRYRASDNGEHLFRFLKNNKLEIEPVFVLNKSKDYYRLNKEFDEIVEFGTKRLEQISKITNVVASSQWDYELYINKNYKKIYLDHGYVDKCMSKHFKMHCITADCFLLSHINELNGLPIDDKNKHKFKVMGNPRFDALLNTHNKLIDTRHNKLLLAPTWRSTLQTISNEQFKETLYFINIQELLTNDKFINLLQKYNYTCVIQLHPNIRHFQQLFKLNSYCKIYDDDETFTNLINHTDLLITDYSSVAFDYAYLKKPVIYFQFDKMEMATQKTHVYSEQWFDVEKNGFGPVTFNVEETVNALEDLLKNECQLNKHYINNCNKAFTYIDNNNCERVYNTICELYATLKT